VIRVAAVGDPHVNADNREGWRRAFAELSKRADLLVLAGDLTLDGEVDEAEALAAALDDLSIPGFAVLGNHDYQAGCEEAVTDLLQRAQVTVLEGDGASIDVRGVSVGVAGVKGFGGGFGQKCGSEFGEREMKSFMQRTRLSAAQLYAALAGLRTDVKIALLHYAPIAETLKGEAPEIYPFLGSKLLGSAIDAAGADLVIHGHAHHGVEHGATPAGIPVLNVAQPVIQSRYRVYEIEPRGALA
jgi:Icc-related predicted phosphoesterase